MRNNRQRIPQAVWFGLMLGLPVAAGACSDDSYADPAGRKAEGSVEKLQDSGADAAAQPESAAGSTEVRIEKTK